MRQNRMLHHQRNGKLPATKLFIHFILTSLVVCFRVYLLEKGCTVIFAWHSVAVIIRFNSKVVTDIFYQVLVYFWHFWHTRHYYAVNISLARLKVLNIKGRSIFASLDHFFAITFLGFHYIDCNIIGCNYFVGLLVYCRLAILALCILATCPLFCKQFLGLKLSFPVEYQCRNTSL